MRNGSCTHQEERVDKMVGRTAAKVLGDYETASSVHDSTA